MSRKKTTVKTDNGKAGPAERRYAEFLLLERIRSCSDWTGSASLKAHVEGHAPWANYGTLESRSRTLDNWLRDLRKLSDETDLFDYRMKRDGHYVYRSSKHSRLSLEAACLTLLAEEVLGPLLKGEHIESGLEHMFIAARKRLKEHEKKHGMNGDAIGLLLDRIAILPRGQLLAANEQTSNLVPVVTGAILKRRCIDARYGGRDRLLHPFGLVFRDPKYYLLAVDDSVIREVGGDLSGISPKSYLCSRFENAEVSTVSNLVPDEFEIEQHLHENPIGIPLPGGVIGSDARITLKLRLYGVDESALVVDLENHPIAPNQKIQFDTENTSIATLIAADIYPTIELLHWLLARGDSVEVLEPAHLRIQVANAAAEILARYMDERPSLAS